MSSNLSLSLATSKNACLPPPTPSPSQTQGGSVLGVEGHTQRRVGGSGSFGSGSTSRSVSSAARSNQSLRGQHKGQRRPRLADEVATAESAAMQSTSSRKGRTSITHLMKFTLPPRPQSYQPHYFGRNARTNPTWGLGSGYHAADKAKYIHANYRFIVSPNGDYHAQAVDADVHLDWLNVLQILVSAQSQSTNCPICLSNPVAPRMAKCGHIFCLPCLIRYMHSDHVNPTPEKKARWKKCPICWDSIYISETRPVRWFSGQEGERPQEGADVVLRLIMRRPGSTLALPRDGAESLAKAEDIPWYFAAEVMDYARIMKGSEDYMAEQYEEEIKELQRQEKEDELMFGEETQWTTKAVASILEAKGRVKGVGNPPTAPNQPNERKTRRTQLDNAGSVAALNVDLIQQRVIPGQSLARSPGSSSSESSMDQTPAGPSANPSVDRVSRATADVESEKVATALSLPLALRSDWISLPQVPEKPSSSSRQIQSDPPFYFYEALLDYYLTPLDIRILKRAFGDFASFPTTVLPRVERVSTGHIIDDELRKRARYLSHLPHGCEVGFLECDWTDVVTPEVLEGFRGEIERRRKRNRDKEVREEKERMRAEKEEDDKRWAIARRRRPTPSQNVIFESDFQPLSETSAAAFAASSPPWSSTRTQEGSAFASLASPSTSPVASKTVWGTRMTVSTSPNIPAISDEQEPWENDGWLQDWERDLLQEEDVITQVEASTLDGGSSNQGETALNGKKKKGKKITLMSTNARRGA